MGAIVAAAVCNRSDAELDDLFAESQDRIHRIALRWRSPAGMWRRRTAMDESQVFEHIVANAGSATFLEAYKRSGRILNISVSPTRTRQKPRVLNYLTSPDVLVEYAAQASCAVPGLFPPVALQARRADGRQAPYMSTETWIDGTVHGDLPRERLARLYNVNQTIVSQANPHVIPFITHRRQRGVQAFGKRVVSSFIHTGTAELLDIGKHLFEKTPLNPVLAQAHAVAAQTYLGDINIQYPFRPSAYLKVISNPTPQGLADYIRAGETATWPQLAMIRDLTRISRVFPECIAVIRERMGGEAGAAGEGPERISPAVGMTDTPCRHHTRLIPALIGKPSMFAFFRPLLLTSAVLGALAVSTPSLAAPPLDDYRDYSRASTKELMLRRQANGLDQKTMSCLGGCAGNATAATDLDEGAEKLLKASLLPVGVLLEFTGGGLKSLNDAWDKASLNRLRQKVGKKIRGSDKEWAEYVEDIQRDQNGTGIILLGHQHKAATREAMIALKEGDTDNYLRILKRGIDIDDDRAVALYTEEMTRRPAQQAEFVAYLAEGCKTKGALLKNTPAITICPPCCA